MGRATGLLIGATFGLVYVLVNAGELGGTTALLLRVLAAAVYAALLVVVLRQGPGGGTGTAPRSTLGRGYWAVLVAEVVAFFGGNALLSGPLDRPDAVLPWVTTVVGVHFLPLARLWAAPSLAALGGALTVCGVTGLVLAFAGASPAVVRTVAGVVPGAVLLAGSWWGALASRPSVRA